MWEIRSSNLITAGFNIKGYLKPKGMMTNGWCRNHPWPLSTKTWVTK